MRLKNYKRGSSEALEGGAGLGVIDTMVDFVRNQVVVAIGSPQYTYIERLDKHVHIINTAATPVNLCVYSYTCKRDIQKTSSGSFVSFYTLLNFFDSHSPLPDVSTLFDVKQTVTDVDWQPATAPVTFNYFKVKRLFKGRLLPGAQKAFTYRERQTRWDADDFVDSHSVTPTHLCRRGDTFFVFHHYGDMGPQAAIGEVPGGADPNNDNTGPTVSSLSYYESATICCRVSMEEKNSMGTNSNGQVNRTSGIKYGQWNGGYRPAILNPADIITDAGGRLMSTSVP